MARAVLNSLSTFQISLIFVGGSVVLAIGVALLIRKLVPDIAERQFEDLASGLRVVYELLFALILAFVIASVLDKFNEAQSTVDSEATALSQMLRYNRAFPPEEQGRINAGIQRYVSATVEDEWEAMRHGTESREAAATLDTIYALYEGYTPRGEVATKFYEEALGHLDVAASARRERLGISTARLPSILVLMLPIGALLLLVLEFRPRLAPGAQIGFMGTLALVLSSTYMLTILLDYPFSGDVSVSNEPLKSGTLAYLAGDKQRDVKPGEKRLALTPEALEGVWASDAYGTLMLRRVGPELRGVYRFAGGAVRGTVTADGVFEGRWCEGTREPDKRDAGLVEWRLVETKAGKRLVTGDWRIGYERRADGSFKAEAGWDLHPLERDQARDLDRRLRHDPASVYCREP